MKKNKKITIEGFTQPTLFDHEYAQYYYNRGRFYFFNNRDYNEAIKNFELAIELEPKNNEYIAGLLVSSYYKRECEKALKDTINIV